MLLHKKRLLKKFAPVVDRATAGSGTVLDTFPYVLTSHRKSLGQQCNPLLLQQIPEARTTHPQ